MTFRPKKKYIYIYIYSWFAIPSLMCRMDSCKISVSACCGRRFDLQWWRSRYALLMRSIKVETAVQWSVCRMHVFAVFSSHGNLINLISIPLSLSLSLSIYIYIYIYVYILKSVYLSSKLLFKKGLLKTMEHFIIFQFNFSWLLVILLVFFRL